MTTDLPQGDAKVRTVRAMFDAIAPRYDALNRVISLGLDRPWRRRTRRALGARPGDLVVDVGCGTGDFCAELAGAGQRPVGIDLSTGMLATARRRLGPAFLLVQGDALAMPFPTASFDGAVSGFALRNVTDLGALFAELARVVRPGGRVALLDVAAPTNPLLVAGHRLWLEGIVPRIGALLSDGDAYRYLPRSVAYLPPPAELAEQLREAGFDRVELRSLSAGLTQLLTAVREDR